MSLVAGTTLVVPRLRTQGALVSTVDTGSTGGYCLGASQRASGDTADIRLALLISPDLPIVLSPCPCHCEAGSNANVSRD